ncbi:MAG: glutathione S-transferase family protein [Acidiphilium sp.]
MGMSIRIWGRANSVNVQKVLWCCDELGIPFERIDAGMAFGQVDTPAYRAMNPNGRVPTLVDGDVVLWESNAIMRYLALRHGETPLYPAGAAPRARVERWLDWTLSVVQPAERPLFWGMVRTAPAQRDMAEIRAAATASAAAWRIFDDHLADGRPHAEGDFPLADIALGAYARRWFGIEVEDRPALPHFAAWYGHIAERAGFTTRIAPPLS